LYQPRREERGREGEEKRKVKKQADKLYLRRREERGREGEEERGR